MRFMRPTPVTRTLRALHAQATRFTQRLHLAELRSPHVRVAYAPFTAALVESACRTHHAPGLSSICTEIAMLYWAAVFFIIAIIAAVFGFGGIAAGAASIAKILFVVFVILFVLSLIFGSIRRGPRL
jgi:uncharacterized membrane protein YtjA (UPF0391 family)